MDNAVVEAQILHAQRSEITEHHIYSNLAHITKNTDNRQVMEAIAEDELRHYNILKSVTEQEVRPNRFKIWLYCFLARVFGYTFALRLMESGEDLAQKTYRQVSETLPKVAEIEHDEYRHEQELIGMLDEERLRYASSMVLGLNDALVELTGAIAGFTLALQNTKIVALVSLITGISASFSMAASEYLSTKRRTRTPESSR